MTFKLNSRVRLLKNDTGMYEVTVGKEYLIAIIESSEDICLKTLDDIPLDSSWCSIDQLELVCPVEPVVPKKPKAPVISSTKPRVKLMSNGRRQFDVAFKLMVVRRIKRMQQDKSKPCLTYLGNVLNYDQGISRYITDSKLSLGQVYYWIKQFDQGHFSQERAVAFSRKAVMVHG